MLRAGHVDLDRRFLRYDEKSDPEVAALLSYMGEFGGDFGWEDLLSHGRVVILGEAGSGKTWEMEAQCGRLRSSNRPAFLIKLEVLALHGLEAAFKPEEVTAFRKWNNGDDTAYFFLDAVDEARLASHTNFETALKRFAQAISQAANRARIVLSCRVSEWRPNSDRALVETLLPRHAPPDNSGNNNNNEHPNSAPSGNLLVVQLSALDSERVRKFASARIDTADEFIQLVDQRDAWAFAGRPRDVEGLLTYWKEHGTLGYLTAIIEADIARKLQETNDSRLSVDPLDGDRARAGAEVLAAAAIFCRRLTFPLPETTTSTESGVNGGIEAHKVLTAWRKGEIGSLFGRALFDEAAYGKVRFHHRNIVEYLAARWLRRMQLTNAPRSAIASLLFRECYGQVVIPESRMAVAAWLASDSEWIRQKILRIAPDILVRYGDPSTIPLPERTALLNRIAEVSRVRRGLEDLSQLRRLADDSLSPTIEGLLNSSLTSQDVKEMLLLTAREGRLLGCGEVSLSISCDDTQTEDLRLYAISVLAALRNKGLLNALKHHFFSLPRISYRIADRLCDALYPEHIDEKGLAHLLTATGAAGDLTRLVYTLVKSVSKAPIRRLKDLLRTLISLTYEAPWIANKTTGDTLPDQISEKYISLLEPLESLIERIVIVQAGSNVTAEEIAEAIQRVSNMREHDPNHRSPRKSLLAKLEHATEVRRSLFWIKIRNIRKAHADEEIWSLRVNDYWDLWTLNSNDITWLLTDSINCERIDDRRIALRIAIDIWHQWGRRFSTKLKILTTATRQPELWGVYRRNMSSSPKRFFYRVRNYLSAQIRHRIAFIRLRHRFSEFATWWRIFWISLANLRSLSNGKRYDLIYAMMYSGPGGWRVVQSYSDIKAVDAIKQRFGRILSQAARRGMKEFWHLWRPPLPGTGRRSYRGSAVALVGLQIDFSEDLDFNKISADEAVTAAHHAFHEINGFPQWFPKLVAAHPGAVSAPSFAQIDSELQTAPDVQHPSGFLSRLPYCDAEIRRFVTPHIADALQSNEPENLDVLHFVLEVLLMEDVRATIAQLAPDRLRAVGTSDRSRLLLWLSAWLQVRSKDALAFLDSYIDAHPAEAEPIVVSLTASLVTARRGLPISKDPDFRRASSLVRLVKLAYQYIRPADDPTHDGAYSPKLRDDAGHGRGILLNWLADLSGREAYDALIALADDPTFSERRDLLLELAKQRATKDADGAPWTESDVANFDARFAREPKTPNDLFEIALARLDDVKDDAENGDFSPRGWLKSTDDEEVIQKWIADKLNDAHRGMYSIAREVEVHGYKKPDIRLFRANVDPTTIEAKWAHKWSFNQLATALRDQLLDQYMRSNHSNHGVLVLINLEAVRHWNGPSGTTMEFHGLCATLQDVANEITQDRAKGEHLAVVGIDMS